MIQDNLGKNVHVEYNRHFFYPNMANFTDFSLKIKDDRAITALEDSLLKERKV